MSVFKRFFPKFQRASIDEAFIDASEQVHARICQNLDTYHVTQEGPLVDWSDSDTKQATGAGRTMSRSWSDLQLRVACTIAKEVSRCQKQQNSAMLTLFFIVSFCGYPPQDPRCCSE
jgi:nucleotidyltransferase/DNA polymerase involved in DNA repair